MFHSNRSNLLACAAVLALAILIAPAARAQAATAADQDATKTKAQAFFAAFDQAYLTKNMSSMMNLLDSEFVNERAEAEKMTPQDLVKAIVEKKNWTEHKTEVTSVEPRGGFIIANAVLSQTWKANAGKEESSRKTLIYFLRSDGGQLRMRNYGETEEGAFDPATRTYTSSKGHYSIYVSENWIPMKNTQLLPQIIPDAVVMVAPDMRSSVFLGFVQVPFKITPQQGATGDLAIEKGATQEHKVVEQGEIMVGGQKAWRTVTEFKVDDKHYKRMRVYFGPHPMLYFFVCDALPASRWDALKPDFDKIVASFKTVQPKGGQTVQQAVAGQLAQGSISGRTYTNKDYNCFIAAPAGWTIRTSPNPSTLVEMQPPSGKSLVRLIGAKGLKPSDTVKAAFEGRLEQVKSVVKDFREPSRRDVAIQNVPGIESIQSYRVEGFGNIELKEVTVVRNGIYYLILCQAMEPEKLAMLQKDFDAIIQSFGFIQ